MTKLDELKDDAKHGGDNRRAALYISILAVLLAVTNLGGGNATKEFMANYIAVSDTYNFYQAKTLRQTSYQLAADSLKLQLATQPDMPEPARTAIQANIDKYQAAIKKYDSDPEKGEGKKELLEKAKIYEQLRDTAARKDPYFDRAVALLEIAIVTASVATMVEVPAIMAVSVILAIIGSILTFNGYTLMFSFPFF
ncbi:DUF4337 domain-containing protein [Paramagnetospirillum marisnigri]|uniref:DUF4337 domain-containing protein n=1 Tax=Paramagnetospirillum marisnigri TaxID=1285242 RepID=UPI000AD0E775|nr:DUF4337 domain-containing protein [Paramagnetospirillum marisnigri]